VVSQLEVGQHHRHEGHGQHRGSEQYELSPSGTASGCHAYHTLTVTRPSVVATVAEPVATPSGSG
jgi:hypothetical protein